MLGNDRALRSGRARAFLYRVHNVLFFAGGFLFDWFTVGRIDSWTDIGVEALYLLGITALLVMQQRVLSGAWKQGPLWSRLWDYNDEALHFLYGGLLSINVVLYFRSSAAMGPAVFFVLLAGTMVLNETPRIRSLGFRLRIGLYAFCVATVLIYLVPLVFRRMGDEIFLLSLALAGAWVWTISAVLASRSPRPAEARRQLAAPGALVLGAILVLYFARLVPPVPLSVQGHGIYHEIERTEAGYRLRSLPPRHAPWRRNDSRPYRAREGDRLVYFVRVFAPWSFSHRVMIRWERWDEAAKVWATTDRIPLEILGGRDLGFRGYAVKENYDPGSWRVRTESEDGRTIALLSFKVVRDSSTGERRWVEQDM